MVAFVHKSAGDEFISVFKSESDDAARVDVLIRHQLGLLDDTVARGAQDELSFFEVFNRDNRSQLLFRSEVQKLNDRLAFRGRRPGRKFPNGALVDFTDRREHQHIGVCRGHEEVLNKVLVLGGHAAPAFTAALLRPVLRHRSTLDVALVRHGHHHGFLCDEVGHAQVTCRSDDLSETWGLVLSQNGLELLFDDGHKLAFISEDPLEPLDLEADFGEFLENLVALKAGQALKAHIQNRLSLSVAEAERIHKASLCGLAIRTRANQGNDLVEMVERDLQTF